MKPKAGETTLDTIFDGRVRLHQPRDGYRFSVDALLLAGFIRIKPDAHVLDIGTGVGVALLALWNARGFAHGTGVELQKSLAVLAEKNVKENAAGDRITIECADIRVWETKTRFDVILSNPPFRKVGSGRLNPDPQKAEARHELSLSLKELFEAARRLAKLSGKFCVIQLPERLEDMNKEAEILGFQLRREREICSFAGETPVLTMREYGIAKAAAPVNYENALTLYKREGEYTDEVQEILQGWPRQNCE